MTYINDLSKELQNAYRKYKTQIYYDNYSAINRLKLAQFEYENFNYEKSEDSNENEQTPEDKYKNKFDDYFKDLAKKLVDDFDKIKKEMIEKINVISFPKEFKVNKSSDNKKKKEITNFNTSNENISKIHYFIDLPVEGHILGILWILRVGYILDDKLYDNCYGNRLNETVLESIKNNESHKKFTPFLFKPYYKNYESWRDNGLNSVEILTNDDKDAIMISLDLKDYYYSSLINFEKLKIDINKTLNIIDKKSMLEKNDKKDEKEEEEDKKLNNNLTNFIKSVFKKYSSKFIRHNEIDEDKYENEFMIPLGFLPSLIIANWNLQGLDQRILEDLNPFYYGRYVDDILIVLESHKRSESFKEKQFIEEYNLESIIKKYFTVENEKENEYPLNKILKEDNTKKNKESKDENIEINKIYTIYDAIIHYTDDDEYYYNYKNLQIQREKLKIYKFSHKFSNAFIKNFRKAIFLNSSEFKLLHESDSIINSLEENCYKIDYEESINKLNNVKDIKINKYEISKLLSQLLDSSVHIDEKYDEKVVDEILNAFKKNMLEYIVLWEKIFSFLYINNYYDKLLKLIEDIIEEIDLLKSFNKNDDSKLKYEYYLCEESDDKKHNNETLNETLELENLKSSLYLFLLSSLIRTLSLKNNKSIDYLKKDIGSYFDNIKNKSIKKINIETIKEICDIDFQSETNKTLNDKIKTFLFSLMQNNGLMRYPLQDTHHIIKKIEKNDKENKKNIIEYDLIKESSENGEYFIGVYPRFIKLNEIMFYEIHREIFSKNNENINEDKIEYLENSQKLYYCFNFEKSDSECIKENGLNNPLEINEKFKQVCKTCKLHEINENNINFSLNTIRVSYGIKNKVKVGLLNTKLDENNIINKIKNKNYLTNEHLDTIKGLINDAINKNVELLIMPEMYIPYEWIDKIAKVSKDHQMAIIFGVEPIVNRSEVGNYIMASLPFKVSDEYYETALLYRLKNHYAPSELKLYKKYDKIPIYKKIKHNDKINYIKEYHLLIWNNIYIAPYYCYEIADIQDRSLFKNCCDIVTVSEFNKDTLYFNSIAESLSRDLFCYCIKSNTSEYGGSMIIQPSSSQDKYIINLKGGDDDYIVTCNLDIKKLREEAIKNDLYCEDSSLKPKPPGFNREIIRNRMNFKGKK